MILLPAARHHISAFKEFSIIRLVRIYGRRPVLIAVRYVACSPTAALCRANTRRNKTP